MNVKAATQQQCSTFYFFLCFTTTCILFLAYGICFVKLLHGEGVKMFPKISKTTTVKPV